jgi:hypothetical protein
VDNPEIWTLTGCGSSVRRFAYSLSTSPIRASSPLARVRIRSPPASIGLNRSTNSVLESLRTDHSVCHPALEIFRRGRRPPSTYAEGADSHSPGQTLDRGKRRDAGDVDGGRGQRRSGRLPRPADTLRGRRGSQFSRHQEACFGRWPRPVRRPLNSPPTPRHREASQPQPRWSREPVPAGGVCCP